MKIWILALPCILFASEVWCQNGNTANDNDPLAVVAGQAIYEDDLSSLMGAQFYQLLTQEYELKQQALENLINQKLIQAEATKKGTTGEQLLQQEVDSKVTEPTDSELKAFYLAQKDRNNRPFGEIKPQLLQALSDAKLQQARQEYIQSLRAKADVAVLLSPPKWNVSFDPSRVIGNPKAPVTIVEFSDFQCPYCRTAYPMMKQLLAKYGDQVKLAYRDFPLRQIHPNAQTAAEASRCAWEQGKFWEYHDKLFEDQNHLDKAALVDRAAKVGLDTDKFDACLASEKYKPQVEQDLQDGMRLGISGTPAFFINGTRITGAQAFSVFEKTVDAELVRAQSGSGARSGLQRKQTLNAESPSLLTEK
ncbi:MAG: thioredoxin domain-containing protein [Acidobacteria bacterium]|nr:thioredoxin domain-containing protein [Acidobacteriota bacterium]